MVSATTRPFDSNASSVPGAKVLTVERPINSSTYNVGEYATFLVEVEAHNGRCTEAPCVVIKSVHGGAET